MTPRRRLPALLALAAGLACGDDPSYPGPLLVHARSGEKVDLSGTEWQVCRASPPGRLDGLAVSERWGEVHGGSGAVEYTLTLYDEPGCLGTELLGTRAVGTAWDLGDVTVTFAGSPPAGAGPSVVASKVYVNAGVSGRGYDSYWLDDTASPRVLYTGAPGAARDGEGYPTTLGERGSTEVGRFP